MPCACAWATTCPQVSDRDGWTSRSVRAHSSSSSSPSTVPGQDTRSPIPREAASARSRSSSAASGAGPATTAVHGRSATSSSAASSAAWFFTGDTDPSASSSGTPPTARLPRATSARSVPGRATATSATPCRERSSSRAHALTATTAWAAARARRSRRSSSAARSPVSPAPSASSEWRSSAVGRASADLRTDPGAAHPTSPSTSTVVPPCASSARSSAATWPSVGHGQSPATLTSATSRPRRRQRATIAASYLSPPLGADAGRSGTTTASGPPVTARPARGGRTPTRPGAPAA